MEVLESQGDSPLPRINHRFGNPQPQIGVQVQKKWERSDYRFPGQTVEKGVTHRG